MSWHLGGEGGGLIPIWIFGSGRGAFWGGGVHSGGEQKRVLALDW